MDRKKMIAIALLLIAAFASASQGTPDEMIQGITAGEVTLALGRGEVFLERAEYINVPFEVANGTREKQCLAIQAAIDSPARHEIGADVPGGSFCLNKDEKIELSATIFANQNALTGKYPVRLVLGSEGGTIEGTITVNVIEGRQPLEIARAGDYYVCREPYRQEIRVRVENNSAFLQDISLRAENDILLPKFEFPSATLEGGKSEEMNLVINTNQRTALGDYSIRAFASSEKYFVEREILIHITQCEQDTFDLTVSPLKRTFKRGETKEYTVTLLNKTDESQEISLSSVSDLPNSLSEHKVTLLAHAEKAIRLKVSAREQDRSGKYKISVYAWNNNEREDEEVEAEVATRHNIEILVQNNDFDARICSASSSQVFDILLINRGDFDEKARLSIENRNSTIQATLSDTQITLPKRSERHVYVFINPSLDTRPGDYTVKFTAKTGTEQEEKLLKFRVIESPPEPQQGILEITSYPTQAGILQGEDKELLISVKNPTAGPMENVTVRILGLGDGLFARPKTIGVLGAKESATASLLLHASEGDINRAVNAIIEARATGYVTTKQVVINVGTPDEKPKPAEPVLSGLFSLFGGEGAFWGVIALIIVAAIIVLISLLNGNRPLDPNITGGR